MTAMATAAPHKPCAFDFFRGVLRSPKLVVAPMVEQSELAWRILSRRYGAQLCYTPMFHAKLFSENAKYRHENFQTNKQDRPLIVQFCANDPETLLAAAKLVEADCDAVDINLGCPQNIARRGHYGSFLQDEWDLIASMVRILDKNLGIPVTCKIRIFPEVEKTVRYARMLQDAGCQVLTVHGRVRDQKGQKTGLADWTQIKAVKEALSIPVLANGNILYLEDIDRCISETNVDGIMTAEGNLYNPALFTGKHLDACEVAKEYLEICKEVPESANESQAKAHLFKMLHACLSEHTDLRTLLGTSHTFEKYEQIVAEMDTRLEAIRAPFDETTAIVNESGIKQIPIWLLQPYVRPEYVPPTQATEKPFDGVSMSDSKVDTNGSNKHVGVDGHDNELKRKERPTTPDVTSSTPLKAVDDNTKKPKKKKNRPNLCTQCDNVAAVGCTFSMCKSCCRLQGRAASVSRTSDADSNDLKNGKPTVVCEKHRTTTTAVSDSTVVSK